MTSYNNKIHRARDDNADIYLARIEEAHATIGKSRHRRRRNSDGDIKAINKVAMKKLDEADNKGKKRPPPLLKWQMELDKRIKKAGAVTQDMECERVAIKAALHLTNAKKRAEKGKSASALPDECNSGWYVDTAPVIAGYQACLEALKYFDPDEGPLEGYLFTVAKHEIRKAAWEMFGSNAGMVDHTPGPKKDNAGREGHSLDAAVPSDDDNFDAATHNLAAATATTDVQPCEILPREIQSVNDLEVVHTIQYEEPRWCVAEKLGDTAQINGGGHLFSTNLVTTQHVTVSSIGQEAIVSKLASLLVKLPPDERALLERWKGVNNDADEETTIRSLAADRNIHPEQMRRHLHKLLQKALQ